MVSVPQLDYDYVIERITSLMGGSVKRARAIRVEDVAGETIAKISGWVLLVRVGLTRLKFANYV